MHRNEACLFLTKLAQNELIEMETCKWLLKARDIVICDKNTILDVLASDDTRSEYKNSLANILYAIEDTTFFSLYVRKSARDLRYDLATVSENYGTIYSGKCEEMYLPTRCKNCPNYAGCEKDG